MLLFLIILFEIGLKHCTPLCDNFFPKIIGGSYSYTYLNDFDVDENTIYTCGRTYDQRLTDYSLDDGDGYFLHVPMVTASDINSN
jgi:hypothetical protein